MSVFISAEAEADLEAIGTFIASDSPARAISFIRELVDRCHALEDQPLRHPIVADYGRRLRRFPFRGYSIYYQVTGSDDVVVVRILNDFMDHGSVLDN